MQKKSFLTGLLFLLAFSFFSCSKEGDTTVGTFYGNWKTSYGDTIIFARVNGKNMVNYDQSMNPAMPMNGNFEYTYRQDKLGIKDGLSGLASFRFYQTFRWLEEGRSFEVQGVEWFPFISSTGTWFTFTKIR
ncbi:MAG TPA: hypothetical protein VIZ28_00835 [Chitinophagaceae bacterium]